MQQEAADELLGRERHLAFFAAVRVVFPEERDLAVLHPDQAVIRDGDAMGVPRQIVQYVLRSAERLPYVHDPPVLVQQVQEARKRTRLGKSRQGSVKGELVPTEKAFQGLVNFPRNTSLSTYFGRKKPTRWGRIQRVRPGANPPAGTTQWICG